MWNSWITIDSITTRKRWSFWTIRTSRSNTQFRSTIIIIFKLICLICNSIFFICLNFSPTYTPRWQSTLSILLIKKCVCCTVSFNNYIRRISSNYSNCVYNTNSSWFYIICTCLSRSRFPFEVVIIANSIPVPCTLVYNILRSEIKIIKIIWKSWSSTISRIS